MARPFAKAATKTLGQPAEAADAAKRAIGLNYFQPQAHLVLARALLTQGKWAEAREAMQTVLRLQPNNRVADAYAYPPDHAHPYDQRAKLPLLSCH